MESLTRWFLYVILPQWPGRCCSIAAARRHTPSDTSGDFPVRIEWDNRMNLPVQKEGKGGEKKQSLAWNSGKSYRPSYQPISVLCHTLLATGTPLFHLTSLPLHMSWDRNVPMASRELQMGVSFPHSTTAEAKFGQAPGNEPRRFPRFWSGICGFDFQSCHFFLFFLSTFCNSHSTENIFLNTFYD